MQRQYSWIICRSVAIWVATKEAVHNRDCARGRGPWSRQWHINFSEVGRLREMLGNRLSLSCVLSMCNLKVGGRRLITKEDSTIEGGGGLVMCRWRLQTERSQSKFIPQRLEWNKDVTRRRHDVADRDGTIRGNAAHMGEVMWEIRLYRGMIESHWELHFSEQHDNKKGYGFNECIPSYSLR